MPEAEPTPPDAFLAMILEACRDAGIPADDERIGAAVEEALPELTSALRKALDRRAGKMHADHEAIRRGFERRLERTWRDPLDLLRHVSVIAYELGEELNREQRQLQSPTTDYLLDALTRLHARGCQVTSEIMCLIRGGYADAAHARWRTLHEISVVGVFLMEHGSKVAERYLLHDRVESYRIARQYREYQDRLSVQPISDAEFAALEAQKNDLLMQFGDNFGGQYGWAAIALGKKRPTFADIERSIELSHFRPLFRMASHGVHAGIKGITFSLSGPKVPDEVILAGPSNTGFADPGHRAALSLLLLTSALVASYPTVERLVALNLLDSLVEEVGQRFLAVQKEVEARDERARLGPRIEYWINYVVCRMKRLWSKS